MKKQQIDNLLTHSENAISSVFQKLPEMLVLFAIPALLFAYIFVKPQLTQNQKSQKIIQPEVVENGEEVDEKIRKLMSDAQTDVTNGSEAAKLENYSTESAQTDLQMPQLDLVGPWTCETSSSNGFTTKLYIENKSVKLITQTSKGTEHMLLKDVCVYTWINNGNGKKQCSGISEMITIAEFASQSGFFDMTSLIDEMGGQSANAYKSLAASCKKLSVSTAIFSVPQGIKWEEDNTIIDGLSQ